ncbi:MULTISPECIES: efflux RND transporter permease subunit [Shewanella]|jgi:multidrug efflux pump|uniref:Efflux pump membrane transporter n=1 Tax=Shewanella xiamenensis TaxID=332186 RepID=A0A073KWH7_9GAMM|nr:MULTISPECIES: efflux RND transporter permease subunit [Shewanella]PZP38213.1 MAG: multidrug efflux RND transporter permease subunit [Shewanella oneidensis]KEK26738.1 hydrophobe/amphiphile efflux-1 (HAE1) family protein [Shewanella xiamenensis]MBW0279578.1 multidrug efflux RND transporter permease subunit [Shewanella xiamenensis]MBW0296242.1 multidrug efflux RND transporter permease subunit [Shewanella xiamenensis]MCD8559498.1 efflux RND transporter permease subunit [Shewanella xiamenensis]
MARFFIDRPIFAWVIALIIMLAGILSIRSLPVSQYPSIAPPTVVISANYPGASAKIVEDSVTQVIEQRMKGIDHLRYIASTSDSFGNASITLTFNAEADPDIAQVQVQNKLQGAMTLLPQEVQSQGVNVNKSSSGFLMVLGFVSTDGSLDKGDIADYVGANIQDPMSRVPGVGEIQIFGAQYAMRIWLDPLKLTQYNLTSLDVVSAIRAQNAQVSAGQLGGTPSLPGQELNATVSAQSRLQTPEQFRKIILKSDTSGANVFLGDVARVELGSESYAVESLYNGKPASGIAIKLATGANALDTAAAVRAKVEELRPFFPAGLDVVYPYDTTPFVDKSIEGVVHTLLEAIVLVFVIMYLFLQNFRATLIPTIAVPVVLLGTFAILSATGFSINTLTMFAMVLAIGLLVDDAIVVVENVERVMAEEGLSPLEATRKSMDQITGALVGIGLTLSAVFVPMAFMSGSTGVIYRQFSITIVSAMALSVLVALILTPALCATMLKPLKKGHGHIETGFFGWFNRGFDRLTNRYESSVAGIVKRGFRVMMIYAALVVAVGWIFMRMPTAFLPDEDQGILFTQAILPTNSTQESTMKVLEKVSDHFMAEEGVRSVFSVAGFSFAGQGQNMGIAFVGLKDWSEREAPGMDVQSIAGRAMGVFSQMKEAFVFAFVPPAVIELGTANGFDMYLQDKNGQGHDKLVAARNQLLGMAAQNPNLVGVRPNGQEDAPIYQLHIDHAKLSALGVEIANVNNVLATAWGGSYVNDFIDRGRVKKVFVQGDAQYRMQPEDLDTWYVRNNKGDMVPFSAFATGSWEYGSPRLERFNGLPAVNIQGATAPGFSTGAAMNIMEDLVKQLPPGFGIEWNGLSYEERLSGNQAPALYALSILVVFLVLAALYESWSVPFAVILVVPLGIIGALLAMNGRGLPNDVFFQVGLLTTVGLATKNAILIVEFAKEFYEKGAGLVEATLHAVRVRLRPILMTSLAFGLGVVPLAISTGVGSGSQNAIGTGVLGGMMSSTFLGIFFVPLFFVIVERIFSKRERKAKDEKPTSAE